MLLVSVHSCLSGHGLQTSRLHACRTWRPFATPRILMIPVGASLAVLDQILLIWKLSSSMRLNPRDDDIKKLCERIRRKPTEMACHEGNSFVHIIVVKIMSWLALLWKLRISVWCDRCWRGRVGGESGLHRLLIGRVSLSFRQGYVGSRLQCEILQ